LHRRDAEWIWRGDATDVALLVMARKIGWNREALVEANPQINQIPFEPEYKFSATYHSSDGSVRVFVKGAPERVLQMCAREGRAAEVERHLIAAQEMAERGLRVLALADGTVAHLDPAHVPPEPSELRFLGFVGMIDPLRPGVREAVEACHSAGITVWMVTGDHPVTALAIARELGFATDRTQVVTGSELAEMMPDELQRHIETARVFARVAPHQKLQLVHAARQAGHFVAVTGDGVNDAPALAGSQYRRRHGPLGDRRGSRGSRVGH
jgi:magnesium-transporting ATPase (P-type)